MIRALLLLAGLAMAPLAQSHPLAPALLQIEAQADGTQALLWRSSAFRVAGRVPQPVLPRDCVREGEVRNEDAPSVRSQRWSLRCAAPLAGRALRVEGLEGSGINVIVRLIDAEGRSQQALLSDRRPEWQVPTPAEAPPVFRGYLQLGVEHLLSGFDHLAFVTGLVLLIRARRRLLWTLTAFTLGHSLTLGLAATGRIHVDAGITEFAIATSILLLALELVRPASAGPGWFGRRPAIAAIAFGLLHGLGFAGALAEIGLPQGEIPLALLAFNLGIEAGQLLIVAGLLAVGWLLRPSTRVVSPRFAQALPAYGIGSLAAYWCLERVGALWS